MSNSQAPHTGLSKPVLASGHVRPSMLHKSPSVASGVSSQSASTSLSSTLPTLTKLEGEDYVDGDGVPYKNFAGIRVAARFQAMVPKLSALAHASRESFPLKDTLVSLTELGHTNPPDWDTVARRSFEHSLLCVGRQFGVISKEVGAGSVSECIAYYYDLYKPQTMKMRASSSYLPSIIPRKPPPKHVVKNLFEFNNDECVVCGDLGDLFMCDSCNLSIHARCATPRIVNEEDPVTCPSCASSYTSSQQVQAREFVISYISALEARKEKFEAMLERAHMARIAVRVQATKRPNA